MAERKFDISESYVFSYDRGDKKSYYLATVMFNDNKSEPKIDSDIKGYWMILLSLPDYNPMTNELGKPDMFYTDMRLLVDCSRRGEKNFNKAVSMMENVAKESMEIMETDRKYIEDLAKWNHVSEEEMKKRIEEKREKMEQEDGMKFEEKKEEKKEHLYNGKKMTFDDICGLEEAKQELLEILDSFENKEKYAKFNVEVPKGVLLYGEPGNSKTCLAESMANMSNSKFYKKCCSEFTAKYLGESAKNIRLFFEEVKKNTPAIVFLEECDAIMAKRSCDENSKEKNSALNQLLNELSSIANEDILVIAATNFYQNIDEAVKRRGRLDRHIHIGNPNKKVREQILELNLKDKPILEDLNLDIIARKTSGRSGADVKGVVQEACMIAIREGSEGLLQKHLESAVDRLVGGIKNKNNKVNDEVKLRVAWHEGNHALQAYLAGEKVNKITIISHDTSLGYVSHYSEEDKFLYNEEDLKNRIIIALAGAGAEEFKFNEKSSGCSSDLQTATSIARLMCTKYGMSEKIGKIVVEDNDIFLQSLVHEEMNRIVNECYKEMIRRTRENEHILEKIVEYLIENEEMDGDKLEKIIEANVL